MTSTAAAQPAHNARASIAFALLAMFILNCQDALIKWLVRDYPLLQVMFFHSVFMVVPAFLLLRVRRNLSALRTKRPRDHLLRFVFHFFGFLCFFFALSRMPLAETIALSMTAPLFITLMSGLLMGETVRWGHYVAILLGFGGVLVIVRPGDGQIDALGVCSILLFAMFYALWTIQTRRLSSTEPSDVIVFFGATGFLIFTALCLPFVWVEPAAGDLALQILLGLISTAGHYCLARAYGQAPGHVIAPFEYTSLIWAVILGFVIFGDVPTPWIVPGAVLVIGGGLYIFRREQKGDVNAST